jgi:hypothetical protein
MIQLGLQITVDFSNAVRVERVGTTRIILGVTLVALNTQSWKQNNELVTPSVDQNTVVYIDNKRLYKNQTECK